MTDRPVNKKPPFGNENTNLSKVSGNAYPLNAMVILTSFLMVGVLLKFKQAYVRKGKKRVLPVYTPTS